MKQPPLKEDTSDFSLSKWFDSLIGIIVLNVNHTMWGHQLLGGGLRSPTVFQGKFLKAFESQNFEKYGIILRG